MKPLTEILSNINSVKDKYELCKLSLTADQSSILRDLSTALFDLTHYKIQAHIDWLTAYNEHKGSNPAKERYADTTVPEMYMIRQIMTSANKVFDSVRSTLSANK